MNGINKLNTPDKNIDDKDYENIKRELKHLSNQNKELRIEIDNLRLEKQKLYIELENSLGRINRRDIAGYFNHLIFRIKRLYKRIIKRMRSDYNYKSNYDSGFKPYILQNLHPLQEDRRRILHAIGNFHTGGSSRLIVDLVEHLGYKFEQEIVTRDLPDKAGYTGLKINHFKRLASPKSLLPYLKKFNPDIIHIHFLGHHGNRYSEFDWKWYHNIFKAAEEYGCRIIENINIPIEPYINEKVHSYIYVSDYVKNKFGRLDSQNITIYPGSDLSFFSRKESLDIPDDCIGMVYRLHEDKLNEHSIDTFIKVVQSRAKTKVIIVGGGKYLESFQDAVRLAGLEKAFTFTGYVSYDELPSLISKMSVFIAPVHTESFGQVSPFAMGMGIPVVGYNVGAIQEIVEDRTLLAQSGDSNSLAEIVIELLNDRDRRLKIGMANRKRAEQLFSVEAMVNAYSKVYNGLLNISEKELTFKTHRAEIGS